MAPGAENEKKKVCERPEGGGALLRDKMRAPTAMHAFVPCLPSVQQGRAHLGLTAAAALCTRRQRHPPVPASGHRCAKRGPSKSTGAQGELHHGCPRLLLLAPSGAQPKGRAGCEGDAHCRAIVYGCRSE